MIVQHNPPLHLTYSMGVHPAESWSDVFTTLNEKTHMVAKFVAHEEWFAIAPRLSAASVEHLANEPTERRDLIDLFHEHRLYPLSIHSEVMGVLRGGPGKDHLFSPDWRTPARRDFTFDVCDILTEWMPEGIDGSIHTIGCAWREAVNEPDAFSLIAHQIASIAAYLAAVLDDTGKEIHLAIEPESDCLLETTEETIHFFKTALWTYGVNEVCRIRGCAKTEAEEIVVRHLGVCFDTAHVAMQFEDPTEAMSRYLAEGVRISKVQLGAALALEPLPELIDVARSLAEPIFLHPVRVRSRDGAVRGWPDLPEALAALDRQKEASELRVHFRVPLYYRAINGVGTTAQTLTPEFFAKLKKGATSQVEIDSQMTNELPRAHQPIDLVKSITREFQWVREHL